MPVKRALGAMCVLALLVAGPGTGVPSSADSNQACDVPTRRMELYAEELPREDGNVRLGWGLEAGEATIPGPLIEMYEGECLAITVHNDIPEATLAELRDDPRFGSQKPEMPLGVSLHVHGVKYTNASDGTLQTDSWVPPGQSRTYFWYAAPRVFAAGRVVSQGTAGYWWFHDHVIGTDHGTGAIHSGLFGGLVVRRAGDFVPDKSFIIAMGPGPKINLKTDPEIPHPTATEGERVEFLVIGLGESDDFHTFHLHGHTWADNRTGILESQLDETQLIDVRSIGPAESFGFQIIAGEAVGPGTWMLHCHVQIHSDLGMVTFFDVLPGNGLPLPAPAQVHTHYGRSG